MSHDHDLFNPSIGEESLDEIIRMVVSEEDTLHPSSSEELNESDTLDKPIDVEHPGEAKGLSSGIFWVLTDDRNISSYKFLFFNIPCDGHGTPTGGHTMELNSKNRLTYNHKNVWETAIKNVSAYRPYNKKAYDYYPRGRVQITNKKADVYLNQNINRANIIDEIKTAFGLSDHNISKVRVMVDNSNHYQCWMDRE